MKKYSVFIGSVISVALLLCSQMSFADSTYVLVQESFLDVPALVLGDDYRGDASVAALSTNTDIEFAGNDRASIYSAVELPVVDTVFDLYRAHRVPWRSSYN